MDRFSLNLFVFIAGFFLILAIIVTGHYFPLVFISGFYFKKTYADIFLSGLVACGTLLLAFATFMALSRSVEQEDKKQKRLLNQFNAEHLREIKENCLELIMREANNKFYNNTPFKIEEGSVFDENSLNKDLNGARHPYDKKIVFGMDYQLLINNKLYKDLECHKITKDIPGQFKDVLELIVKKSPEYLKNFIGLINKIKTFKEYDELLSKLHTKYNQQGQGAVNFRKGYYITFIIIVSLDYDNIKYAFPNLYDSAFADNVIEDLVKIGNIAADTEEAKVIRNILVEINKKMGTLKMKIKKVLDYDGLLDECDYLKRQREILL
ncbi:MAG: hypothetical protein ACYDDB_08390 [bacterium]